LNEASFNREAARRLKLTREGDGRLIVEGTKAQLDAAVRLLGQIGSQ